MQISIVGTGYVGLTTAVLLARLGHEVIGVDKDQAKLEMMRGGKSPIHEYGLDQLLALLGDELQFTDDLTGSVTDSEVIIIAVGTPPKKTGEADISAVEAAALEVADGLASGKRYVVVVKSTVPIGTNKRIDYLVNKRLKERGVDAKVTFASNPEFLREGKALHDSFYPERVLIGAFDDETQEILIRMYKPLVEQTFSAPSFLPRADGYKLPRVVITDPTSAELSKYACNAFLAVKISFMNEIAGLCERVGADVTQVSKVMGLDSRIGPHFLNAGLGWGGSCLPKDTSALKAVADDYSYELPLISASRVVNERQLNVIAEKLQSNLKVLRGQTIGVLGMAFKPDTDDVRMSASIALVEKLLERGANLRIHDPIAVPNAMREFEGSEVEGFDDVYDLAEGLDAIVLATEWGDYRALDLNRLADKMSGKLLVDSRNFFRPEDAKAAGFDYVGVGR